VQHSQNVTNLLKVFEHDQRQSVPENYEGMRGMRSMKAAVADSHVACLLKNWPREKMGKY